MDCEDAGKHCEEIARYERNENAKVKQEEENSQEYAVDQCTLDWSRNKKKKEIHLSIETEKIFEKIVAQETFQISL